MPEQDPVTRQVVYSGQLDEASHGLAGIDRVQVQALAARGPFDGLMGDGVELAVPGASTPS